MHAILANSSVRTKHTLLRVAEATIIPHYLSNQPCRSYNPFISVPPPPPSPPPAPSPRPITYSKVPPRYTFMRPKGVCPPPPPAAPRPPPVVLFSLAAPPKFKICQSNKHYQTVDISSPLYAPPIPHPQTAMCTN